MDGNWLDLGRCFGPILDLFWCPLARPNGRDMARPNQSHAMGGNQFKGLT